ncbi:GTPase of unknown function subfamily protein [Acanthamoeba castellanii str. Neff]|uniref:Guanine nucleotide-binding protein-like 1 n=1 Tax=Acanthamoeba castellanii (strain ATCC 30010 / Neff) TaxID=1257118 RepID=L8HJE8_ACACF|nr:GTPase of unknown function subfamily protein [Acanthamoeba castellanii str. Neff]ELR25337.1 GTPase of unknown function subfamily protein [Acanthamoeba castellanii str. Neff]
MRSTRKKVFGNKKKKEQLKAKREQKRLQKEKEDGTQAAPHPPTIISPEEFERDDAPKLRVKRKDRQPKDTAPVDDRNKLRTVFEKESKEEVELRKKRAQLPLARWQPRIADDYFYRQFIGMPKRPPWSYSMTKQQLEEREKKYFDDWLANIYHHYPRERLNYFEHNLEVWRQLWRVIERSDILVIVADARHPLFHFPPSLYSYVAKDHKKPIMLVLNKIDLVPEDVLHQWVEYFEKRYPLLKVVTFTSYPNEETVTLGKDADIDIERKRKKRIRRKYHAVGGKELMELAARFARERGLQAGDIIGASEKQQQQQQQRQADEANDDNGSDEEESDKDEDLVSGDIETLEEDLDYADPTTQQEYARKLGFVTIGMVGHPNAGKSSLINGLMGKKVVSTSSSPGHTKYLQTIFYSKGIRLCDCPGLTFPALDMPKPLQVLAGLYPIAQVREPYSAVGFLAERAPVEKVYGLTLEDPSKPWSAWELCERYAQKRDYTTRHGAWDTYRAGNEILRDALDGRVLLFFYPPEETPDADGGPHEDEVTHHPVEGKDTSTHDDDEKAATDEDGGEEEDVESSVSESSDEEDEDDLAPQTQNAFALLEEECP